MYIKLLLIKYIFSDSGVECKVFADDTKIYDELCASDRFSGIHVLLRVCVYGLLHGDYQSR